MVVTRRSTGGSRARPGPGKNQSIISFATRVTKPGARVDHHGGKPSSTSSAKDNKDAIVAATAAASVLTPEPEAEEPVEEEEEVVVEEDEDEEAENPKDKSEAELEAEEIGEKQIRAYVSKIENARLAKPVHQEDLSEGERILRYFDVSARYGPCIGISRHQRWLRAHRLGLSPPVEVLAVLLQEEAKGTDNIQMAHMDRLMSSTAIGAA
jgi:DNA polymerase delta subunit 4